MDRTAANQTYFAINSWARFMSAGFFGMGKMRRRQDERA
jgi:hypothetical protein